MNTQIAIPIDSTRKHTLIKNLKTKGMTTKAFIIFCIDAFNNGDLTFGVVTKHEKDNYLTAEEREEHRQALIEFERGEYDTLEDVMKEV
jgi:antitoxin component of RelBE/YafQ-DinJ toxin-antitoxin module